MLLGIMQDIAGLHEISMGQIPERGSHIPAAAFRLLQESEAIRHAPSMRSMKGSLKQAAAMILRMVRVKYKEARYFSILGDSGKYELRAFQGAHLGGNFDISFQVTSAIAASPIAKAEMEMQLWDRDILQRAEQGDPAARKVLLALEMGDVESFTKRDKILESWVNLFLEELITNGKVLDIHVPENGEIIARRLEEYVMTKEFIELSTDKQDVVLKALDSMRQAAPPQEPEAPEPGAEQPPAPNMMQQAEAMGMGGQGGVPPGMGM
jgi:hypothetical protein